MTDGEYTVWAVRIHECDGVNDDSIAAFCCKLDGAYFMAKESEANRVHYQGWFVSKIKDVTLRARVKKAFPSVVGNNGYSLKPARESEKYMRYICKGTRDMLPLVICKKGIEYSEDWVKSQWEAFWQHEASEAYELKKSKQSVTEVIWSKVDKLEVINSTTVVNTIIKCYIAVSKPYDIFGVRRLRNIILSKYDKTYARKMEIAVNMDDLGAVEYINNSKDDILGGDIDI